MELKNKLNQKLGMAASVVGTGLTPLYLRAARRPRPTESDYSHRQTPFWQLNYVDKYLWPRLAAESGTGLEEYFLSRDLNFPAVGEETSRISLRAVGDLMCRPELVDGSRGALWERVSDMVFGGDLSVGNLEFSINDEQFIFEPIRFAVPQSWALPLIGNNTGRKFDYLSIANNHINDSFFSGIRQTCEFLDSKGIPFSGASRDREERDNFPIIERGGIKLAMLAYTFSTNGVPLEPGTEESVNIVRFNALREYDYDDSLIRRQVEQARERGADYIVANCHWCCDHEVYPPKRVVNRAHEMLEFGVDLIIGHHPHIIGPVERYQTSDGRQGVVLYSLSNLTSHGLPFPWQRLSLIADIELVLREGVKKAKVTPGRLTLFPVFYSARNNGQGRNFRIIPMRETLAELKKKTAEECGISKNEALQMSLLWNLVERVVGLSGVDIR